ncbi:WXG100 family type VII secretion target [Streptomyces daghestanicus]|uniref:PPE family domain-containing protein n=1 Tax=Streptomyces daghestanicus TaxID=66885 RepID=A0ABQ3Q026_9ACTN|nr:hypothetical protein [Streptomyces daghestanicus]GGU64652.1 hypothetical protein GCM10010259_63960 [Streptomyces daghestanicus]GHI30620.1 hypothetical protein Sdagh_23500 [Streptomyces daghestanicus]
MSEKSIDNFEYVPADQCFAAKHTTPFGLNYDMDQMKDMVRNADPATVKSVSEAWADLSKDLVGGGGIKETLETAVQHVLSHWEGASADLFRERAQVISQKITDSAKYADNTSQSLKGAAVVLDKIKDEVLAMEKPSGLSSAMDWAGDLGDRDASGADNALKNGASADDARNDNEGSLSAGREAQLKMAAKMEILGAAYNSRAAEMGSWNRRRGIDDSESFPGDPGGIPPAAVVIPTSPTPRSPQGATSGTARGAQTGTINSSKPVAPPAGITGGAHKPPAPTQPQIGTAIDGVTGGRVDTPTVGHPGTANAGSTGNGSPGGGSPIGGTPGIAGRAGTGAGRGGVAGRVGAGGTAGRGSAGAGAGIAKGGASARAGAAARQPGGVVGGAPRAGAGAGAGRGTAGGSGLHRSRGAAGGAGAVRKGGMAGVPGGRTNRPKDQESRESERPDYLVEDEETWMPQTNAAPRVIE